MLGLTSFENYIVTRKRFAIDLTGNFIPHRVLPFQKLIILRILFASFLFSRTSSMKRPSKYLKDARRVIKPGGKIIFSFLEFAMPSHWAVFENSVSDTSSDRVLNQFLSRDAITAWAEHLELSVLEINGGGEPCITLDRVIRWKDGREMKEKGAFGQSVCILTKN